MRRTVQPSCSCHPERSRGVSMLLGGVLKRRCFGLVLSTGSSLRSSFGKNTSGFSPREGPRGRLDDSVLWEGKAACKTLSYASSCPTPPTLFILALGKLIEQDELRPKKAPSRTPPQAEYEVQPGLFTKISVNNPGQSRCNHPLSEWSGFNFTARHPIKGSRNRITYIRCIIVPHRCTR